jgi:hypothetical protein
VLLGLRLFDDLTLALEEIIPFWEIVDDVTSFEFLSESRKF